jgi:phage host-nuclease inhibitor protein Gam
MAREKKVIRTGVTRDEMETAFAEYAKADAKLQKVNATIDLETTKIREKHAGEVSDLEATKEKNFDIVQAYSLENRQDLFAKKRSIEGTHGTFGFRTGTPKLKTLKGFTWGAVTNMLKEFLPAYVRTTEEPAKDKLLADRDDPEVAEQFGKVGIAVTQDEAFFIELKKENEP